jgi:transcriptional regulator with XRE-family HTH domain
MEKAITHKIRQIRQNKNITLKSLAGKSGLTESYLSKIENSDTAPPISTLSRIAQALDFDISYFFRPDSQNMNGNPNIVIERNISTKDARFSAKLSQRNVHNFYEPLALKKRGKNMEPFLVSPDFELAGVIQFNGEVFQYILNGEIELFYGTEKFVLYQGDSSYFDANVPFQTKSVGKERAMILVITYPYKRK